MLAPIAPLSSAACFTAAKPWISGARRGSTSTSFRPARTSDGIAALKQPGEHQREVRALRHELDQRVVARQRLARAPRFQRRHRGCTSAQCQAAGTGIGTSRSRGGQHQAAEQHRADVVAVPAAAGDRFAGQRERIQRFARPAARRAARWRPPAPPRRRPPNRPCPEPSAMPLSSSSLEAECGRPSASRSAISAAPAVLRSASQRQVDRRCRGSQRCAPSAPSMRRTVARSPGAGEAVAEDVEADADVADAGRRERTGLRRGSYPRSQRRCRDAQQVGEHAGGGDLRARARALHDQRIVGVAAAW